MKRIVIGFGGKRRRGKDTSAAYAVAYLKYLGLPVRHDFFAYSLKEAIGRGVLGFTDEQLYGNLKEVEDLFWGFSPRWALQHIGTDLLRKGLDNEIWAKTVERRAGKDPDTSIILSDLRFPNEVDTVKRLGGYTVLCSRDVPSNESDFHASETALDHFTSWDFRIDNNGTVGDLALQVQRIVDNARS